MHDHHIREEASKEELIAMLEYMSVHNSSHSAQLTELGQKLKELGFGDLASTIEDAVGKYSEGNAILDNAVKSLKIKADEGIG